MINNNQNWRSYFRLSLFIFCAFLLEYFSLFVIEMMIMGADLSNFSKDNQSIHHIIMVCIWIIYITFILFFSCKKYHFPIKEKVSYISKRNLVIALICLFICKIMTFIDWNTLKVIGEMQGKNMMQYIAQYAYYIVEVGIVLLIIMFGQKAFEVRQNKDSSFPYGGLVLALTWGIFHFISRGVGFEIWNGISCVIFSILSGIMYLKLDKNYFYSYIFIAIGYLL